MATQHLPTSLPPGWESDYDGASERWFFVHRPTGFSQFFFPKAGDETTRVAQLAQPQPTNPANGSLTAQMEAMTISAKSNTTIPNQQATTIQQATQYVQAGSPSQPTSTPQAPPSAQQSPSQGTPLARTVSGTVQRKAIPRRDSVQSQASQSSAQSGSQPGQPIQQYQVFNSQTQSNTSQIVQNIQPLQQRKLSLKERKERTCRTRHTG
jgi:hypothetical protein